MTRPVMPDDEAFDYLPTQAIADFLATENEPQLDGIVFPSVQVKNGRNVVLFHKAARVEAMILPEGTEISARSSYDTEEGAEVEYRVFEETPPTSERAPEADDFPSMSMAFFPPRSDDTRAPSLRIDPLTVKVHHVDWADYNCTTHEVPRHRFEKRDLPF